MKEKKLKVYFTASTAGKKKFYPKYKKIIQILQKMENDVLTTFLTSAEQKEFLKKSAQDVYEETKKQIEESDIIVAELGDYTFGSFGIGWRVNYALSLQKPVLCLFPENYDTYYISPLLKGSTSEFLTIKFYNLKSLRKIFEKYFMKVSNKQDMRINFYITPLIDAYLDWVTFRRKIPKSKVIRDLIFKEIESDNEYQKIKKTSPEDNSE